MATRFYLPSSGAAACTPTTTWDWNATGFVTYKAVTSKISSAFSTSSDNTSVGWVGNMGMGQWISDQLAAQTIASGTQFTCAVRARYTTGSPTSFIVGMGGIVTNDGSTIRYYLSMSGWFGDALTSTLSSKHERNDTGADWTVNATDRFWVTIAMRKNPTSTWNMEMEYGDNSGSDVPYSSGDTNQYAPWFECSQTLNFAAGASSATPNQLMQVGCGV